MFYKQEFTHAFLEDIPPLITLRVQLSLLKRNVVNIFYLNDLLGKQRTGGHHPLQWEREGQILGRSSAPMYVIVSMVTKRGVLF